MGADIEVQTADGVADAYLARAAEGSAPSPGVLLIPDAYGLRPRIRKMADRIAGHGYHVLAPNLYYRVGRAPCVLLPDTREEEAWAAAFATVRPLIGDLTPERIAADAGAYLDALERVTDGPFALTGYCMGARLGLRVAAALPDRVAALGCFHGGGLVTEAPDSPHRIVRTVRARLYLGQPTGTAATRPSRSPRSTRHSTRRGSSTALRSTPAPATATRCPTPRPGTRPPASATSRRCSSFWTGLCGPEVTSSFA